MAACKQTIVRAVKKMVSTAYTKVEKQI